MFLSTGHFGFGLSPSKTSTSKAINSYGKLYFGVGKSSNASADHYLDGYAAYNGNHSFLFPIGDLGVYAPIQVSSTNASIIDAAYFHDNPGPVIGATFESELKAISEIGYWDIYGNVTLPELSLSWSNLTNISVLTNQEIDNLVVVGYNPSNTTWEQIKSSPDSNSLFNIASDLNKGSITALEVDLRKYRYFTLASKNESCLSLPSWSGTTKTWNGSWNPSPPTLRDAVVVNAPLRGSLKCNSLILNSDLTLANGQSLEIVYGCSGSGKVIMESEAALVQRSGTSSAPNIELVKSTIPKRSKDYVYWGTPISGNFYSQIQNAIARGSSSSGAFDVTRNYLTGTGGGWQLFSTTTTGKGFIARVKPQAPFTDISITASIDFPIKGIANNGDISVSVRNDPANLNSKTSYELLGNPYPSAIDGSKFLSSNTILDGTLYFWTASTPLANKAKYNQADYAMWNLGGYIVTSPTSQIPTGKIASGQGFKVKALGVGNVIYTNCIRLTNENNIFFKTANKEPKQRDRYKLTLTNQNEIFSQVQIGYFEETSYNYDRMYDAERNSASTSQLCTFINDLRMAINTRPSFDTSDVVKLGITKGPSDNGTFKIQLSHAEGVFLNDDTKIFLFDSATKRYIDLKNEDYTFSLNSSDDDRFKVVYQIATLDTQKNVMLNYFAYINFSKFYAKAQSVIARIDLYDITGKLVETYSGNNSNELLRTFIHPEGIYIARILLDTGSIIETKVMNTKQ